MRAIAIAKFMAINYSSNSEFLHQFREKLLFCFGFAKLIAVPPRFAVFLQYGLPFPAVLSVVGPLDLTECARPRIVKLKSLPTKLYQNDS